MRSEPEPVGAGRQAVVLVHVALIRLRAGAYLAPRLRSQRPQLLERNGREETVAEDPRVPQRVAADVAKYRFTRLTPHERDELYVYLKARSKQP